MSKRKTEDEVWRSRAWNAALTELTHEYWDRYRKLLADEYLINPHGRPQSRAKSQLRREKHIHFAELYAIECARMRSLPPGQRVGRRPPHVHIRKTSKL